MNWIRANKFSAVLLAVLIAGIAVLGYLVFTSSAAYTEASEKYDELAGRLQRLHAGKPYPSDENVRKLTEEREKYTAAANELQERVSRIEFPAEPLTPEQFQDRLRGVVAALVEKAQSNQVTVPEKFYLGFEAYLTSPPRTEAATALGYQLKGIEFVVDLLIENRMASISGLIRPALPEERGAAAPAGPAKPAAGDAPGNLLKPLPFGITFTGDQARVRRALNSLSTTDRQFYVIRNIRVKNQAPGGPARTEPVAVLPDELATPVESEQLELLLGTELIEATLSIEMIDFPANNVGGEAEPGADGPE